jgi:phosphonate transport system permease protein
VKVRWQRSLYATILGIVGAGGIGREVSERLRINNSDQVRFILIMLLVVVGVLDAASRGLRRRFTR